MAKHVRVVRIIVYEGSPEAIHKILNRSVHGTTTIHDVEHDTNYTISVETLSTTFVDNIHKEIDNG